MLYLEGIVFGPPKNTLYLEGIVGGPALPSLSIFQGNKKMNSKLGAGSSCL
jgi:hypothetical protein